IPAHPPSNCNHQHQKPEHEQPCLPYIFSLVCVEGCHTYVDRMPCGVSLLSYPSSEDQLRKRRFSNVPFLSIFSASAVLISASENSKCLVSASSTTIRSAYSLRKSSRDRALASEPASSPIFFKSSCSNSASSSSVRTSYVPPFRLIFSGIASR